VPHFRKVCLVRPDIRIILRPPHILELGTFEQKTKINENWQSLLYFGHIQVWRIRHIDYINERYNIWVIYQFHNCDFTLDSLSTEPFDAKCVLEIILIATF
jgi:hypothetical protein